MAGCSGATTTIKEIPEAAASDTQAATSAPAVVKTVAGEPAPTVVRAAPAPVGPAAAFQYCGSPADQGGISVNSVTSCPFAENVESAWESSGDASSVTAYSPASEDQLFEIFVVPVAITTETANIYLILMTGIALYDPNGTQ